MNDRNFLLIVDKDHNKSKRKIRQTRETEKEYNRLG